MIMPLFDAIFRLFRCRQIFAAYFADICRAILSIINTYHRRPIYRCRRPPFSPPFAFASFHVACRRASPVAPAAAAMFCYMPRRMLLCAATPCLRCARRRFVILCRHAMKCHAATFAPRARLRHDACCLLFSANIAYLRLMPVIADYSSLP